MADSYIEKRYCGWILADFMIFCNGDGDGSLGDIVFVCVCVCVFRGSLDGEW